MRALSFAAAGALVIAGCGGSDKKADSPPKGKPDPQAKAAAQAYVDAYTAKSAKAICAAVAPKIAKQLADNKGTCIKTIRFSIKGQKFPKLRVITALVDAGEARATIAGSKRQVVLHRIAGAWKVVDGGT